MKWGIRVAQDCSAPAMDCSGGRKGDSVVIWYRKEQRKLRRGFEVRTAVQIKDRATSLRMGQRPEAHPHAEHGTKALRRLKAEGTCGPEYRRCPAATFCI